MSTRRFARLAGGILLSGLLLVLLIYLTGWAELLGALGQVPLWTLVGAIALALGGLTTLGISWWLVLSTDVELGIGDGLALFYGTFTLNTLTPLGQFGGEPFIVWLVSRRTKLDPEEGLGLVLVADTINAVVPITIGIIAGLVFVLTHSVPAQTLLVLGAAVLLLMGLVATLTILGVTEISHTLLSGTVQAYNVLRFGPLPEIDEGELFERVRQLEQTVRKRLRKPRTLLVAGLFTALKPLLASLSVMVLLQAMGASVSLFGIIVVMTLSGIAGFVPTPGGIGGIEGAMAGLFVGLLGVEPGAASAAALAFRFAPVVLGGGLGGICLLVLLQQSPADSS